MANNSIYAAFERMWQHITAALEKKVNIVDGKELSTNDFTNEYKSKVDSALQSFTETDPTVPSWAKAASKPSYTAEEVGAATSGHTHSVATTSANGFMSAADKSKLDGVASGANAYTHPTTSGNKHIPSGGSSGQILRWSADGTAVWGADNNTTYPISSKFATTAATARWYRIATSSSGISNCTGIFQITAAVAGKHTTTTLIADTSYGMALSTNINVLSCSNWEAAALTKARIVYHTTYQSNYAYLEVYLPNATATPIKVNMFGNVGWTLVNPNTAGSVPSGYSTKEVNLVQGGGGDFNYTATIGTSWSGSAAPYSQSITVTGITANDKPIVDVTMSGTYSTDQNRLSDWGKIYRIVTAANKITVYATAKTSVSLPIQLQVVR